jgi:hypothetical protein
LPWNGNGVFQGKKKGKKFFIVDNMKKYSGVKAL